MVSNNRKTSCFVKLNHPSGMVAVKIIQFEIDF